MKYRILVTGANGQLGNELRELSAKYSDYEYVFTDVAELDITSLSALNDFFQKNGKFDFLINCAAYTAVDAAESNQELAFKLNTTAVDMLVEMAGKYGFFLIQISTDYVFDGEKNRPYDEEDVPLPALLLHLKLHHLLQAQAYASWQNLGRCQPMDGYPNERK